MLHSEAWLTDRRFEWWHADFVLLLVNRLKLQDTAFLVDVGVGLGHWSRALAEHLPSLAAFTGIDLESEWLKRARPLFHKALDRRGIQIELTQADAISLPVKNEFADLVTCQTLLMHLANPEKAIDEMYRITKPGGAVLCVEPINLIGRLAFGTAFEEANVELTTSAFRFWKYFQKGLAQTGQGDHNIGCRLPLLLKNAGFKDLAFFGNEKPSYERSDGTWSFEDPQYLKRIAIDGGASEEEANDGLDALEALRLIGARQTENGTFCHFSVSSLLIAAGRK